MDENLLKNLSLSRLASRNRSALLLSDGTVYTFGGDEPQFDEEKEIRKVAFPKLLSLPKKIIQICVGNSHSLFLTSENTVYGIGSNQFGQLGLPANNLPSTDEPLELNTSELQNKEIIQIQTGIAGGTNILTRDGIVYTAGELCGRDCGPEHPHCKILPIPSELFHNEQIRAVFEGGCVKIFITLSGAVYVVGSNSNSEANGVLGLGPSSQHSVHLPSRMESLWELGIRISNGSAGRFHCIVIDSHGHLYGWGGNRNGALGRDSPQDIDSPTEIPIFKPNSNDLEVFRSVSCSWYHSLALTNEGKVYAFGSNHFGQLGIPHLAESASPTLVSINEPVLHMCAGGFHSIFVMTSTGNSDLLGNEFRTCGLSRHNQLGSHEDLQPILQNQGRDYQDCRLEPSSENQNVHLLCKMDDYVATISYKDKKHKTRQLKRAEKKRKEPPLEDEVEEKESDHHNQTPSQSDIIDDSSFESVLSHFEVICQKQVQIWYLEQVQIAEERSDDRTLDELENGQLSRERYEKSLSDAMWDYYKKKYSPEQFSKEYENSLDTILTSVRGFSDFREVFADLFEYVARGIQEIPQEEISIVVKCVEVCSLLYSTVEVDTFYHSGWVEIVLQRSIKFLSQTHLILKEINDHPERFETKDNPLQTILDGVLQMIELVQQSGTEYQNEMKSLSSTKILFDLIQQSLELCQTMEFLPSHLKLTLENKFHRLLSLCSDNPQLKIDHLNQIKFSLSSSNNNNNDSSHNNFNAIESNNPNRYSEIFQQLDCKMIANSLLDGYNSMCEETDDDLHLQLKCVSCELSLSAMSILHHVTEGSEEVKGEVLIEAIMWFSLLLQFWNENDLEQMRIKREIANILKDLGIIEGVMRHMEFWAIEWNGCYGDCGFGVFQCLRYLSFYFPEVMKSRLQQCDQRVLDMISATSQQQRGNSGESARLIMKFLEL
jgi:alpha-tubulin suppressor-like RCC1 family protein